MCMRFRDFDQALQTVFLPLSGPKRQLLAALLSCAFLVPALALPVQAFELFGVHIFGQDEAEQEATDESFGTPVPYSVIFDFDGGDSDLDVAQVRRSSSLWQGREEPALGVPGLLADARSDYRRILGALYANGRYGGTINILVDGREAATLPPDTDLTGPVAVIITVEPGPLYRFSEAAIANQAPYTDDPRDQVPLPFDEGFAPGAEARSGVILRAERLAVEAWRQQGYALAEVTDRHVEAIHPDAAVDAAITVDPGRRAYYGPVAVEGTERMDPAFVAYMAGLEPGEEYDPDDIDEANARLAALDVFRSVRLEEAAEIAADGTLPSTLFVQERALRRIGAGGSFSTTDGLGLEAYWLHRNLFGRAERLRVEGRVSGIDSVDPDDFTYRFGLAFTKPGVYTPDTRLIAALNAEREVINAYERTGVSGQLGFEHTFSPELTGRLFVTGRHAEFSDAVFGNRSFTSVGFEAAIVFDSRDIPSDARSGFYLAATAEPFYEFTRSSPGVVLIGEARAYQSLVEDDSIVLAARLKIGTLIGPSIANTAPDRLFLAGGGGSVRGYGYRTIGVTQPGGAITGGRSLLEGSAELRARVTDTVGLVAFADIGHVGADSFLDFSEDMKVGVGVGLRYLTPLGPIRLDVGVPLNGSAGDPDFAVYIGIGQSF